MIHYGGLAGVILPLWTLSVEEQFYAVIPALMKWGGRNLLAISSVIFMVLAYLTLLYLGHHTYHQNEMANLNSFVEFQFFAGGTIFALILHRRSWKPPLWLRVALLFASLAGLAYCVGIMMMDSPQPRSTMTLLIGYLLRFVSTAGFFFAFLNIDLAHLGPFKVLTYMGRISYGLYVYHMLVLVIIFGERDPLFSFFKAHYFIGDALGLVFTTLIAAVSYRWFELPVLRLKSRFEVVKTGVADRPAAQRQGL